MLTGASEFPNLHEAQVAVLDAKPVELAPYGEAKFKFDALPPMRLAAPFERLRDRSDANPEGQGRAAESLPRQSRHACRLHRARDLCKELLRDRRDRGGRHARGLPIRRRWPPPSRPPARRWPACVRPTRSMPHRRLRPQRPFKPPAQGISIWQGGRASRKPALRAAGVNRFHLCRRRCAGDAAGGLSADGVKHDDGDQTRSDRRLPMRRHPLCAVGAAR